MAMLPGNPKCMMMSCWMVSLGFVYDLFARQLHIPNRWKDLWPQQNHTLLAILTWTARQNYKLASLAAEKKMPWIYSKTVNICGKYCLCRHWLTSPVWHFCSWLVDVTPTKRPKQWGVRRGGCIIRLQCIHCGIPMLPLHWNPVKLCLQSI